MQFVKENKLMSHRSHSAEAESNVGFRMEPDLNSLMTSGGLISDLFANGPVSLERFS